MSSRVDEVLRGGGGVRVGRYRCSKGKSSRRREDCEGVVLLDSAHNKSKVDKKARSAGWSGASWSGSDRNVDRKPVELSGLGRTPALTSVRSRPRECGVGTLSQAVGADGYEDGGCGDARSEEGVARGEQASRGVYRAGWKCAKTGGYSSIVGRKQREWTKASEAEDRVCTPVCGDRSSWRR